MWGQIEMLQIALRCEMAASGAKEGEGEGRSLEKGTFFQEEILSNQSPGEPGTE